MKENVGGFGRPITYFFGAATLNYGFWLVTVLLAATDLYSCLLLFSTSDFVAAMGGLTERAGLPALEMFLEDWAVAV